MTTKEIQPINQKANSVETQRFLDLLRKKANELQESLETVSAEITALEQDLEAVAADIVAIEENLGVHVADSTIHFVDRFADKDVPTGDLVGTSDIQVVSNKIVTATKFGTSEQVEFGNYSEFEADGTLKFNGKATVWEDAQIVLGSVQLSASNTPNWQAYRGGYVLSFSATQDNLIYFTCQLSHKYQLNSNLEFHIHVVYPNSNAGNSVWNFTYSWAKIGSDFPTETTVTKILASPLDQDRHSIQEIIQEIPGQGVGTGVSSMLICSLEREGTAGADTYGSAIYLVAADFHFICDTVGSREETVK